MITTLNTILKQFEIFASNHKQINTFYSGESWDFQANTNVYPAMIVAPDPATIARGSVSISFRVLILDICPRDSNNNEEILSDTLQIVGDFFSYFRDNEDEFGFIIADEEITADPVEEEFDDIVAGWFFTTTVEFPFIASNCNIPI